MAASALAAPVEGTTFEGAHLADKLFTMSESNRRISELSRGPGQRTASNRVVPPNSQPADGRFNYGSTSKHTHSRNQAKITS